MPAPCYFDPARLPRRDETVTADLAIYGGTSAGVAAAVQARRMGLSVVLLHPGDHLGGLSAGGLGQTDIGNKQVIGGLSRDFYRALGRHYGVAEEWRFEPHAAAAVFAGWVAEHGIDVRRQQWLESLEKAGGAITALTMLGGLRVRARQFIDATYEGDLMAMAGVPYHVGREANAVFDETINGVQVMDKHQFEAPVDPYVEPGRAASGLLPGIDPSPLGEIGSGDHRVQAYNFRVCMTKVDSNRIPFAKPPGYDAQQHELLARHLATGWNHVFRKFDPIRGDKTDTNNHGAVSTDFIGASWGWPDGGYAARERLFQAHVTYQQGQHWFLANDARVPAAIREEYARWGLARDEFTTTGGWPHQLYVREARRMIADQVVTEHDCRGARRADDPVGMGSYGMDSHNCRRFVADGQVRNEGDVQVATRPYGISYRCLIPPRGHVGNLAVPVCCSASHIAYGSLRMEPVFMILGQSAATACAQALAAGSALHDLPYAALRERLLADGQVLASPAAAPAR